MSLVHRFTPMSARDPHETHRTATPLELLFDLTFVVAFSQAAGQAAHYFEEGHTVTAIVGLAIAVFAVTWAWINLTWLASAYDNDDVLFRLATLIEMVGVVIMALGLPVFFASIDTAFAGGDGDHPASGGQHIDNAIMIAGYVVMRVATIALWLRAARNDPARHRVCLTYAVGIAIVQVAWIVALVANPPAWVALTLMVVLAAAEMTVPYLAERIDGGTPWHPHHIAERYSLLVLITLGEVVTGTVLAVSAVVDEQGWSVEAVLVAFGGLLLAFTIWWSYFILPSGRMLHRRRDRSFGWGYLHIVLFGAVAAVGAGLHVASAVIGGHAGVGESYALWTLAVPVLVYLLMLVVIYELLLRTPDLLHLGMLAVAVAIVAVAIVAGALGASLGACIVVIALAPAAVVVGYEAGGWRRSERDLQRHGA